MAIQAEPIILSGERITLGVAIVTENGAMHVAKALSEDPLECAFGRFGKHLSALADQVLVDIQAHLSWGGLLENWQPKLQGIYSSRIITTANDSIEAIQASALRHSSLFSAKGRNHRQNSPGERQLTAFQKHIRDIVVAYREGFEPRFSQRMRIFGTASTTFSYVGNHLAINLATVDATLQGHSQQRDVAVRKLNQLAALRDHAPAFSHRIHSLILGLWVPQRDFSERERLLMDSYLDELYSDAKRLQIELATANGMQDMREAAQPLAQKILEDD